MPTKLIKSYAKESGKSEQEVEAKWNQAKERADKKFDKHDEHYWAYVNESTRKSLGMDKDKKPWRKR